MISIVNRNVFIFDRMMAIDDRTVAVARWVMAIDDRTVATICWMVAVGDRTIAIESCNHCRRSFHQPICQSCAKNEMSVKLPTVMEPMSSSIAVQHSDELIDRAKIQAIVQKIVDYCSPQQVILFGSYASGQATPESDLDLLVVMQSNLPKPKRAVPLRLLFRPVPCSMDILVYTPEEVTYWKGTVNHIITTAFQTGEVLYERSPS